jgi:tetratricopeptide (TPR) repeat protein
MRAILISLIIALAAVCSTAQGVRSGFDLSNYGVRIEPDKRLIVVLSALEMAQTTDASGAPVRLINTPLSEKGTAFRARLAEDNASLNEDLRRRISDFVTKYKRRYGRSSDAELIAPFISMAYALSPPPELADPVITNDLPGSLLDVLDFAPLVREFYRRSTISSKLDEYAKLYRTEASGTLQRSSRETVSELLDYLHTRPETFVTEKHRVQTQKPGSKTKLEQIETKTHERHFSFVPEMLAPVGSINFVNARDDYYVVVPPDKDVSLSEARRAFLQFVVDPLVINNSREIDTLRDWARPKLDEIRKTDANASPDILLNVSRSLAAATDVREAEFVRTRAATIQARQRIDSLKTDEEKRAVAADLAKFKEALADESLLQLSSDYDRGLVLVFFFADKLKDVEESGFDISASLRDMLTSFDPARENARVAAALESRKLAAARRSQRKADAGTTIPVSESPVTTQLREIQKTIESRNYDKAVAELNALTVQNAGDMRIYYTLGRVAGLQAAAANDADEQMQKLITAKEAYSKVVETPAAVADKALLSLSYVALARIYEHFDNPAYAVKLYDEAIKLGEVTGGAFSDAMAAKQRLIRKTQ